MQNKSLVPINDQLLINSIGTFNTLRNIARMYFAGFSLWGILLDCLSCEIKKRKGC